MITKIVYDPANHEDFVQVRNRLHAEHRLGGSDVGTAAGQNRYKSRLRFFNEMTGRVVTPDISGKQAIIDGILGEETTAMKFTKRTGKKVHRVNAIQVSDGAPHLFASIDRKVEGEDAGLECKTANALNWDAFKNGRLPDSYVKQVKTYMKVTGYRTWYVYVWVMGCAEYCYLFTLDEVEKPAWCDTLVRVTEMELDECEEIAAKWFDDYVIPGVAPECDGSEDEAAFLAELAPEATDLEPIALVKVTEADLKDLALYKQMLKTTEENIAAIEDKIKAELGSHAEGTVGEHRITWKNNRASAKVDWKGAAAEAAVPEDIIRAHTTVKPGARVLRIK